MKQFVIAKRTPDKFEIVNGTQLNDSMFAHIGGKLSSWVISDIKSGMMIQNKFPSLASCKEWAAAVPEDVQSKIDLVKNTDDYRAACDQLHEFVVANLTKLPKYYESLSIVNPCYIDFPEVK